ncbi:Nucleoporin 88kDa [Datura stramonium]|uniref:Nucleoporin 88kDa n=1 Tax=Datura stramonium TaxID=4076 RepID=A0ABS8T0S7_DATST|nr:Nucleoporin 88kDa [Datura stramonium]
MMAFSFPFAEARVREVAVGVFCFLVGDRYRGVELDALRSSIEAVNARLKRYTHSPQANRSNKERQPSVRRKSHVQENEMSLLKASLEKLSLVNIENAKKVKVVESALKCREIGTT